jgi:hypothetical protein
LLAASQIEQQLKLCRFVAGLHGPVAARLEASETVGLVIESLGALSLQEDRLVALVEAGQVSPGTYSLHHVIVSWHQSAQTPETLKLIIESLGALSLQEDRLVALVEAGQVMRSCCGA